MSTPHSILNSKAFDVFVITAETLDGWKNPITDEGKKVLLQHYAWGEMLKKKGYLLLAGPTDSDLISTNQLQAVGHMTGIIFQKVSTREEAERLAFADPFHLEGFRKNSVYAVKITMSDEKIFDTLAQLFNQ